MSTTTLRPGSLVGGLSSSLLASAAMVVGGATLVGLLAQISFHLSFTPVPITGQTLGVLLVGSTLGARRATAAMALYVAAGLAGLPWFAGHTSGYVAANFGYLLGFIASAAVMGLLADRGNTRQSTSAVGLFVIGEVAIYVLGVPFLAHALHLTWSQAIADGVTPFIVVDVIKAVGAGALLPMAWRLVGRR